MNAGDFDTIILSSSGVKGYLHLGCLQQNITRIQNVKRYVGTSGGACIALLLVCGYQPIDIFQIAIKSKLKYPSSPTEWLQCFARLNSKLGFFDSNPYIDAVSKAVKKTYGYIPTMKQLYELTKKELTMVTTCANTQSPVYINHETYPDMSCILGVDMSSRLPPIFSPIMYDSQLYVDGGASSYFSLECANPKENTLAMMIITPSLLKPDELPSITNYGSTLIDTAIKAQYSHIKHSSPKLTIYKLLGLNLVINATIIECFQMFIIGCNTQPLPLAKPIITELAIDDHFDEK